MNTLLSQAPPAEACSHLGSRRYHVYEQVGLGGFCQVFRAWDSVEQRMVALKLLRKDLSNQKRDQALYQIQHEAHMLMDLMNPDIIRLHHYDSDAPYLALDYIEGDSLTSALRHRRLGMPLGDIYVIGQKLCRILSYLHEQQIVFCDLSANNVMISLEGDMFLIDFGIAQKLGETRPDLLLGLGTPGYAAPELYPANRKYSIGPVCDIYSLGALLHYACSGDDPTRRSKPFIFPTLPSRIPPELALLIREMLVPTPNDRPTLLAVKYALDAQCGTSV